ncbi:MAG: kynureninase [Gemmatimonadales bacterium]
MIEPSQLYRTPNALAPHYSRFRVAETLRLTGHSHQSWPDCGFEGQQLAWLDAAEYADEKWDRAFAKADRVRDGFAKLLDDEDGHIALGQNTHELIVRFLSALPLRKRPRIVTTDGEFHTVRRQLDRLAEETIEVEKVTALPASTLAERLAHTVDDKTAAVIVSSVLFQNAHIVPGLGALLTKCQSTGTRLLVDAYHALNVVPFSLRNEQLGDAFVVGGGYKYCQLGEGNCFLRIPPCCKMRPVITGWFGEFGSMSETEAGKLVQYADGADRFAGATYDPTSHYRASEVFDFFEREQLTPGFLRQVSQHQVGLLAQSFDDADLDEAIISRDKSVDLSEVGGFLALRSPLAESIRQHLGQGGVLADNRGDILRLGPAPYLSDEQLCEAMDLLVSAARP